MALEANKEPSTPSSRTGISAKNRLLANNFVQSTIKALSPIPLFSDPSIVSKDDHSLFPTTPQRPNLPRGLSLQLPEQDPTSPSAPKLGTPNNVPLSPRLDPSISFGSSILPRRSRGLDFSRACTNLHHSTLAESSPDSSPVIGNKGMTIPRRSGSLLESPMVPSNLWSTTGSERVLGTSIGSNAMDTSDSSESDEDMVREEDDTIHMTPQPMRSSFALATMQSPGFDPLQQSPAAKRLANFARRLKIKTRRKLPVSESPSNLSPPLTRGDTNGYFGGQSRRESLNLSTHKLDLSDDVPPDALGLSHPQVIRRAVTRRSNMLPKPKGFARIRAALQEESCPVESESKHEAAVIRHVRESDNSPDLQAATVPPSPSIAPTTSSEVIEELNNIMNKPQEPANFGRHALRNSGGSEFWDNWDERNMRTPPPPFPQRANSTVSEDVSMETTSSHPPSLQHYPSNSSPSRSSTPQPIEMRKTLGKRRRDDDFDPAIFKRRAVSPGLSHSNSPILPPSPAARDGSWGWQAKAHRESSASSNGTPAGIGKRASRVGMQGMTDTSDGMMNMSIE